MQSPYIQYQLSNLWIRYQTYLVYFRKQGLSVSLTLNYSRLSARRSLNSAAAISPICYDINLFDVALSAEYLRRSHIQYITIPFYDSQYELSV